SENRISIMTSLAPLFQRTVTECHSFRVWPRIEIDIPVDHKVRSRPIARQQRTRIEIDNVRCKTETDMRLIARSLKLLIASKSEDVVPNHIRLAVMLMKSAVSRSIDHVACRKNSA